MNKAPTDYRKLPDIEAIVNAIEVDLRNRSGPADKQSLPWLALLLATTLQPLPDDANAALSAARAYLEQGQVEGADIWIDAWARRIDAPAESSAIASRDRLVWIALNRNSAFSDYGVEFTLQAAEDAGLDMGTISATVAGVMQKLGYGVE